MSGLRSSLLVLLIAPYAVWVTAGDPDVGLRHDPFGRPDLALMAPASGVQAVEFAAKEWKPQLRAVIVAGKDSMVNVAGTIIPLGGQIDGFRLIAVEERKAVFTKGGAHVELTMGGERAGGQ